ncbi:MAG: non-ribosomal peptide synthetase, partial [Myxococcota bacterium]
LTDVLAQKGASLWNFYGPTEASVAVTAGALKEGSSVNIGRPLRHADVYILDSELNLTPIGVAGELFIAGPCLARGYWSDASQTAARFVPNPFGRGSRMYRTGDWARWTHDGHIEFMGRIDDQISFRGYRVELGEIEAVLRSYRGITNAVVVAQQKDQDLRVIAYFTQETPLAIDDIRAFVESSLPHYMVPSAFVALDTLPQNANGKVDKKALPEPTTAIRDKVAEPVGPFEQGLAKIWQQLLGVPKIDRHDRFANLGGHSILITKMMNRIRSQFAVDLAISDVYRAPSLSALAALIADKQSSAPGTKPMASLGPIQPRITRRRS